VSAHTPLQLPDLRVPPDYAVFDGAARHETNWLLDRLPIAPRVYGAPGRYIGAWRIQNPAPAFKLSERAKRSSPMQNDNSNAEHLDDCHPKPPATHHVFIAGTGRAGTSFLVQYLHACGLETTLALHPDGKLDEHANAGLEDYPTKGARLPYVMKSPWLYEFVDEMLERDDLVIDAVIMPMRDIVEAAASRAILEMGARFRDERVADDIRHWETWGCTPGGVVYP
jgi:hypothetical protein